jgi:large subunit ribosomal protein L7Ae
MSSKAKAGTKKVAAAPKSGSSKKKETNNDVFRREHAHLFSKDPRDYRIGRDIQPRRDLTRFVRWPRYIRIQRQRAILNKRLKVPPAINQFSRTLDKNQAGNVFKLLAHYRPETPEDKKKRLKTVAEAAAKGKDAKEQKTEKPLFVKFGLNHITKLVEEKKAKLVVIAHDVDPIELVVWLPALCRKMDVPYCIVKGKARLGQLVHKKTASVVAVTEVKKEDQAKLEQITSVVKPLYNENVTDLKRWGGGVMGGKAQAVTRKREKAAQREAAKKA